MIRRSLGYRAPLLWIVLPFIAGLAAEKSMQYGAVKGPLVAAVVTGSVALMASLRNSRFWSVALVTSMIFGGMGSYALHRARLRVWDNLPAREAKLTIRIEH